MCKYKLLICLILSTAIAGCASSPTPSERKAAAVSAWRHDAEARETRGELTRINKLKELYALLAKEPVSVSDVAGMRWARSDIATLEAFQASKIDRLQAETQLRASETAWRAEVAERDLAAQPISTRCVTWQGITQCATR